MKTLLIFLLFFLSTAASVLAVEDTLIVVLKDGRTDFIPISKIERIVFGNITSIGANDSSESELSILGTYPNPFEDFTEIKFISKGSGITWLCIYNNLGQCVKKLYEEAGSSFQGCFRWDGRDAEGRELPSGNYFAELSNGVVNETIKLIIIR